MNKKGQLALYGIMVAMAVFIATVVMIPALKDQITYARDSDHLDCSNASISTGMKMTCLIVDLYLPYFVAVAIAAGFGYMFTKKLGII